MGELARHLPSAGGMYTYVGRGLGSYAGWLIAWAFLLASIVVPSILFAAFGFFGASFITELTGYEQEYLWVPLTLLCAGIVWYLTYRGISISTRVGVALGLIEIGIMVFVSALLVINAGSRNTVSVFIPGDAGIQPALQGMVFCLLAFVGFEAAAPLAEETRDPKRNTRRAILWSAILIGLFYVFCYYAATVFFGPDKMADFFAANDSNPWGGMAERGPARHRQLPGHDRDPQQLSRQRELGSERVDSVGLRARALAAHPGRVRDGPPDPSDAVDGDPPPGDRRDHHRRRAQPLPRQRSTQDVPGPLNTYFTIGYAIGLLFAGHVHGGQPRRRSATTGASSATSSTGSST